MKSNIFKTTVLLALLFSGFISAQDESLSVLNLQGVVRDDKGGAVDDDNYPFTFRIYNVLTGGTALWEESQDLDVISGVYSANLGEVSAFSTGNSGAGLGFDEPYYIGVSFNNKNEISPRVRLTAAPYALALQGAGNTFPSSGTVTVGTSSDPSQLDVEGDVDISGVLNEDSDLNIGKGIVLNRTDENSGGNRIDFNTGGSMQFRLEQADTEDLYLWNKTPSQIMKVVNSTREVKFYQDLTVAGEVDAGSITSGGTVNANNLTIDSQAPFVIRRYDMGTKSSSDSDGYWTTTKATGYSSSSYFAAVIGVNGGKGGIDATNQYLFGAFMYDTGSSWTVYSRFPGNTAGSTTIIWVLFIQKELVDGPTSASNWN